jgi:small redox-active disulfide protein 2
MPEKVKVLVLGAGCSQCGALEEKIRGLAAVHQLSVDIEKISELQEIMKYGIMMTPGLVIDGVLKSYGKIPKDGQLLAWIKGKSK